MMCAASATVLTLLLNCLMLSEGTLSPPLNVSVEVFDLQTLVRWLPEPGHPTGTRYDLEFIDIIHFSKTEWNQTTACTNITSTQCYLMLNEFFTNYYVRVMAKWREERSSWTIIEHSFQPYSYNKLSPPEFTVFTKQHSICVNFSHALLHSKHGILKFSVDLYEVDSPNKSLNHIKLNTSNSTSHCFEQLPPGNYCITASAYLTQEQRDNYNSTKCVLLEQQHKSNATFMIKAFVIGGSVLLLTLFASIAAFVWCNLKYKMNKSYIPRALLISETSTKVLTLIPEEPQLFSLSATDYYRLTLEELDDSASLDYNADYFQRVEEPDRTWSSTAQLEKHNDYIKGEDLDRTDLDQTEQVSFFTINTMNTHQRVEEPDRTWSSAAQMEKHDDYMRGEDLDCTNLNQTEQVSFFTITTMNTHQKVEEPDQTLYSSAAQIQKHDDYIRGEDLDSTDLDQTKQVSLFTITTMNNHQRRVEVPTLCSSVAQMEKHDDYTRGEDLDCTDFDQNDQVSLFTITSINTHMFERSYPGVKLKNTLCSQPELFDKDTPAMELHRSYSLPYLSEETDSLNSDIYESNGYESRPAII